MSIYALLVRLYMLAAANVVSYDVEALRSKNVAAGLLFDSERFKISNEAVVLSFVSRNDTEILCITLVKT